MQLSETLKYSTLKTFEKPTQEPFHFPIWPLIKEPVRLTLLLSPQLSSRESMLAFILGSSPLMTPTEIIQGLTLNIQELGGATKMTTKKSYIKNPKWLSNVWITCLHQLYLSFRNMKWNYLKKIYGYQMYVWHSYTSYICHLWTLN